MELNMYLSWGRGEGGGHHAYQNQAKNNKPWGLKDI